MPVRGAQNAHARPVVHMPCGQCGVKLTYFQGDTGPLLKHMAIAHPRKQVLDFGTSEVENDDDRGTQAASSREDCSLCFKIEKRLMSQLANKPNHCVGQTAGSSDETDVVQVGSSSGTDEEKINRRGDNKHSRHWRSRFTRKMKDDQQLNGAAGKARAVSKPAKPLLRSIPLALKQLMDAGDDLSSHKDIKRTVVFHPAGKLYSNFKRFSCPECGCERTPVLRVHDAKPEMSNNQCLLTACWPLMLLPTFFAYPKAILYLHCAKCNHFLGTLDKNGFLVTEVHEAAKTDTMTTFGAKSSATGSRGSALTQGSGRLDGSRALTRRRRFSSR